MKPLQLLPMVVALSLSGCLFINFNKVTVEYEAVTDLLEGQKLSDDKLVMREGQSIAIAVQIISGGKDKNWGSKPSSRNESVAGVHETTERNVYVVTGRREGTAKLQFRIHDHRWYTARKEYLDVQVLARRPWSPSTGGQGGAGGASGALSDAPPAVAGNSAGGAAQ